MKTVTRIALLAALLVTLAVASLNRHSILIAVPLLILAGCVAVTYRALDVRGWWH